MNVGEKIKKARKYRSLTQSALAGERITRNMLSQIERGAALPSLPTIAYISERLGIDVGYFFSDEDDLIEYERAALLRTARALYKAGNYKRALSAITTSPLKDKPGDELALIAGDSAYEYGNEFYRRGHLKTAESYYRMSLDYFGKTAYRSYRSQPVTYALDMIKKVADPGLRTVFPSEQQSEAITQNDTALYTAITNLIDDGLSAKASAIYDSVRITNELFRLHINAKLAAACYNWQRARELLNDIISRTEASDIHTPFCYFVLLDLEKTCRALSDFEGAYRCSEQILKYLSGAAK